MGPRCMPMPPSATRSAISDCERSEEHTSELQSQSNLVCRLLLEKKKKLTCTIPITGISITTYHNQPTIRYGLCQRRMNVTDVTALKTMTASKSCHNPTRWSERT